MNLKLKSLRTWTFLEFESVYVLYPKVSYEPLNKRTNHTLSRNLNGQGNNKPTTFPNSQNLAFYWFPSKIVNFQWGPSTDRRSQRSWLTAPAVCWAAAPQHVGCASKMRTGTFVNSKLKLQPVVLQAHIHTHSARTRSNNTPINVLTLTILNVTEPVTYQLANNGIRFSSQ